MTQQLKGKPACVTGSPPRAGSIAGQTNDASKPVVQSPSSWVTAITCLLLALAVWVVFGQTLHHEFVNYDDQEYVYENSAVTQGLNLSGIAWAFTHPHVGNWHPLTSLSHMLDCQFYGLKPGGHHLTNVLLHAATAILLFLVLRNLTGAFWPSAFVAAVFALHPLRVESVAWVAERKDVLSGLFFVLTLGAYVRYVRRLEGRRGKSEVKPLSADLRPLTFKDYWLALLLFTLGLLSKPMLVTLPFVLLLLDYWPLNRLERSTSNSQLSTVKRLAWEKIPFLLLSAAACVATLLAQRGAIESVQNLRFLSRIGNALVAYAVYIGQMLCPVGLAVLYPHPANQLLVWTVGLCGVVLSLITVGVVWWQRKRPYLLVGWLWYLGMLVPVIGILQVGSQARADRYTYLPHIGLYVMVAWGAVDLCGAWRGRRVVLAAAAAAIIAGLLVVARVQTGYWRDSVSLWTHTLACTSGNPVAHNGLGVALAVQGKWHAAIPHYERALQLNLDYAEARSNLGIALAAQGKLNEAIPHYERALQLDPDSAEAHSNFGVALAAQGKWPAAIQHYERALQLKPGYAEAHSNLGIALAEQGKQHEAIPQFERALQLKPDYAEAHYNLGSALAAQGKWPAAIPHYARALQLKPDYADACFNLGNVLAAQGKWQAAIPHYERALQFKPDYADAHNNFGVALAQQGKWDAAIPQFERALQLKPDYAEAGCNLAWLLATCSDAQFRNPAEALRRAQRARELTQSRAPEVLDTLAAAQAAGGDFVRAVATAKQALALATAVTNPILAREIQSRLDLYEAGQPFCEPPPDGRRKQP